MEAPHPPTDPWNRHHTKTEESPLVALFVIVITSPVWIALLCRNGLKRYLRHVRRAAQQDWLDPGNDNSHFWW